MVTCLRLIELIAGAAVNVNVCVLCSAYSPQHQQSLSLHVITQLSFHILLPGLQMPRLSYVWSSCESYRCRDNPDASGQKLQAIHTAARHHDTDQQLHNAHATEPVDDVASGHEPFGTDEPFMHSNNDGEVNLDPPELLDNLFKMWNQPPNVQGPDNFSTDKDEEIIQQLG